MDRLGRYNSIRKIGSGGMAEVFLARSEWAQGTEKLLVIKKIHPALSRNRRFIDMFVDEASVAMRLNHVNIVQVYTFEKIETDHVLAMEYVDGFDLQKTGVIARKAERTFPQGLAAFIAAEVAKGLDYAHSRSDDRGQPLAIVHRDVSPQNILVSLEGEVKVADFGIARAKWLHKEAAGTIRGKFGYMAPEQALGGLVDRRSDVYSLGVVLYEMLAGRPFIEFPAGRDPLEILRETPQRRPSEANPSVSKALDEVVLKCLAKNPDDRYQTARELAMVLNQYLHRQREIYDALALQKWIASIAPHREQLNEQTVESSALGEETGAPTLDFARESEKGTTTKILRKEAGEQRILVVVQGRIGMGDEAEQSQVHREFMGLINEIAFKADGVLEQQGRDFAVFLGILHSSNEDAIGGIRLAFDALDALRAISTDRETDVRVKLAVTQGVVQVEAGPKNQTPKFTSSESLLTKVQNLFEMVEHNAIIADDRVFRLARREYHFKKNDLGRDAGRDVGRDIPSARIRSYRIIGAKSRLEKSLESHGNSSFFGREDVMSQLGNAMHSTINSKSSLVAVKGEMGIGKSRVLRQFMKSIPRSTVRVFSTECLFAERDKPLSSAMAVIRAVLGITDGDSETEFSNRLKSVVHGAPVYAERQEAFFRSLLRSEEGIWGVEKSRRREIVSRTAAGLGVLLSLATRDKAALLVVENAHWLDGPSVDILSELAAETEVAVMVVFVGHPSTLKDRHVANLSTIEIGELDDELISKLIMERLGHSEGMGALTKQIVNRVNGNPFFAEEIIESLLEQDILARDSDSELPRFKLVRPGTIRLPATMEGIALARLDSLASGQRSVLRTAAAMGANFTIPAANLMIGRDTEADVLALVGQSILVPMGDKAGAGTPYRFRQTMIREAAYESLLESEKTRIHQKMARQLIEGRQRGEGGANVRIAWHLDHAGQKEKAGRYYLDAGNEAMEIYSDREALRLYDRALVRLGGDSPDRFEALSKRERVLRDLMRHKERREDLAELERIADAKGDLGGKAYAITRMAQIDYDTGDFVAAAEKIGTSLELAARSEDAIQQIEALRLLAYVAVEEGHLVRGLDCCNRALVLLGETSDSTGYLRGRALGIKGFVLLHMGDLDATANPLAQALVLFRRIGKRRNESQVMSNLAVLAQARGEFTEAVDFLRSAMRIDAEIRDVSARGRKLAALGMIRLELGDFGGAESDFNTSVAICRGNNESMGAVEADLGIAELLMARREYSQARRVLEGVSRSHELERSRILLVRHRQIAARALFESGMPTAARRLAEEATRVSLAAGMMGEAVHCGLIHGFVLARSKMAGEALLVTRRAVDLMATLGRVRRAEQAWWLHARTLNMVEDPYRANKALDMARQEVSRRKNLFSRTRFANFYSAHPTTRAIEKGFDD